MADNVIRKTGAGKVIHSQGREIISNVYSFMKSEAKNNTLSIPLSNARRRTAAAVGFSERVVTKINSELKKINSGEEVGSFATPNKIRKRKKPVTGVDEFDKSVIRRHVYEFHLKKKQLPTTKLLLNELRESIDFQGGLSSLRSILRELGFKWRKTQNNRRLLIETNDIREKRISYLRALKRYRESGRPIIFLDETYVLSSTVKSMSWSDDSNQGVKVPLSKGDRMIIIHAGGEKGFVPNALLMWKASCHTGDYHDNVNTEMFTKWLKEKLLPNLEPKTVIVIDNAPYHNSHIDKAPTSKSRKQEMKDWLTKHGIPFSDNMFVPELYKLIQLHKPTQQRFLIDEIVRKEGHDVLRLPPYHPDLNPIELIWADIKGFVSTRNTTCSMSNVKTLCEEKISNMGAQNWLPKCDHVRKIENKYIEQEGGIDEMIESFVISLHSDSDSDSEGSDNESDTMSGIDELD